ncbi:MAG TPA: Do family serine endopeptidase [Burkholderiaceae bacterium]|nr:Do family serine endopeptidase [Burkholderiaceae bacterium]
MHRKPIAALFAVVALAACEGAMAWDLKSAWDSIVGSDSKPAPSAPSNPSLTTPQTPPAAPAPAPAVAEGSAAPPSGARIEPVAAPNYRAIVQQFAPAVVGVTIDGTRKIDSESGSLNVPDDPFFQFFRGMPGFQLRGPHAEVPIHGQGSGFIVSSDGLVLTNAHVVREASEVTVRLHDRREFHAKVLGVDPTTDVAVLRIDAKGLPTVRLGDPKQLQVGDYVLAIGAPFGFESTATSGIVSAKGRSLPGDSYVPFIQTDAAINPGNSGGPLFDASGGVVGINAQIYSTSGGFQGLAFAVPIDVALQVKDQIVATGHASHARLGVYLQDLDQSLADSFGLARPDGALVSKIEADSAAATAGLKPGDVITAVDGQAVQRSGDVSSRIGMAAPGEKIALQVWRDRASRNLTVTLGKAKAEGAVEARDSGEEPSRLGLALRPLNREERSQGGVDHGLVVEQVAGAAQRAGIEPGDIVLSINGVPAQSVDQLRQTLKGKPKSVALLIQRGDQQIFIPVKLG